MNQNKKNKGEYISKSLDVIKAGIERFYSEGYIKWSKKNFLNLFNEDIDINDPELISILQEWEKNGIIRFVGKNEVFIEVLKTFT
jgi:hypothetical protein